MHWVRRRKVSARRVSAWLKITAEGQLESVIAKFLDAKAFARPCLKRSLAISSCSAPISRRWCMMCWGVSVCCLAEELNLIDKSAWKPLWVTEFPLLDYSTRRETVYFHAQSFHRADG